MARREELPDEQWSLLVRVLEALAEVQRTRGGLDLSECFIDGTFIVAKQGEQKSERPSGAEVRSSWQWQTALVFLSSSASPHEVTLVQKTLVERFTEQPPERLIGYKAYDSDPLDAELAALNIELIAPTRAIGRKRRRKTDENSGDTGDAGKSNDCSRGCKISTNVVRYEYRMPTTWALSILVAS